MVGGKITSSETELTPAALINTELWWDVIGTELPS
jgi:hypothetical protein